MRGNFDISQIKDIYPNKHKNKLKWQKHPLNFLSFISLLLYQIQDQIYDGKCNGTTYFILWIREW